MKIRTFKLERYLAKYEFNCPYLLSASDCESLSLQGLLDLADSKGRNLWSQLSLGYTETQGHPLLRKEIVQLYECVTPENVLIVTPEEGIFIAMNALLEQGDHIIVNFPCYQSLYEIAQALGCQVTRWTLQTGRNGWELDLGFLKDSINDRTKLLVVNFPHNPTGFLPSRSDLEAIINLALQHDLYILSDEMYWLLEYELEHRLPSMCDRYEKGISLFGLSKTFSLPGLRIGWLTSKNRVLINKFASFKDYTTICSSAPSEILAIIALRASDKILSRNISLIRDNLEIASSLFNENSDWFEWLPPLAGSVAFPRLRKKMQIEEFCQSLGEYGVLVLPGSVFEYGGNHFRLGLGRQNLSMAIERIHEFIASRA